MQEDLSYQPAILQFSLVLEGYTSREFESFVQFALHALDCIYHYSGALYCMKFYKYMPPILLEMGGNLPVH